MIGSIAVRETGRLDGKMHGALWWITAVTAVASIWVIFRVLLEPDPDSIRDPGAAARYAPPSGS